MATPYLSFLFLGTAEPHFCSVGWRRESFQNQPHSMTSLAAHGMFSPTCVPTALISCPTCDTQDPGSTEDGAPQPVFLIPVLIQTLVSPTASLSDAQQHGVDDPALLGFHAVQLQPILAEDNSGSRKQVLKNTLNQDNVPFLSAGCVKVQDRSLESTWRDGTGIPPASVVEKHLVSQGTDNQHSRGGHWEFIGKDSFLSFHLLPHDVFIFWTHSHTHHQSRSCRCSVCSHQYLHHETERVLVRGTLSCSLTCSCPCPCCGVGTISSVFLHTASPPSPSQHI